jgi:polysaccharide biosynthesis protein PslH
MKILFISSHYPYAPSYGTQIRIQNIGIILKRFAQVSYVIAPYFEIESNTIETCNKEIDIKRLVTLNRKKKFGLIGRIRHELDPAYLNTDGLQIDYQDRKFVMNLIKSYDVIWVHTLLTANAFRIYRWPHTILDIDDIPSRFFESRARYGKFNLFRRLLDLRKSVIWKRRERSLNQRFNGISVASEEDKKYLGKSKNIYVIPNGFNRPLIEPIRVVTKPARIGFIGSLEYYPNKMGMDWFITDVWSKIKFKLPDTRLRIIGKFSDKYYRISGHNIDGLGWILDPSSEISTWLAMIVPVQIGAGTRVKIAEAFSKKVPVVSTSLGAYGYEIQNGENILIANDPNEFSAACIRLIEDYCYGTQIAENAWKNFLHKWTWEAIAPKIREAVEKCKDN